MTESEAKTLMEIEKECINRDCDRDCAKCDIVQKVEDLNEAYDMAIQALEKQIPKKSVHNGCFDRNGVWHEWNGINGRPYELCPCCSKNLCCEMPYDPRPDYCKYCGQKLDWSDEE